MGFKLERRTAKITFPDNHEYAGLEMECKLDVDLQTFLEIQAMAESATPDGNAGVYTKFGEDILVNWNLEDEDGTPVSACGSGFLTLPPNVAGAIITAWTEELTTVGEA